MSENTAIIPNLSDHRNATFSAGEADNITQLIDAGGFLFGVTLGTPAKAIKINKDNFADRTPLTFANDGKHINAVDTCYSGGFAYVIFNTPDVLTVAKVNVSDMTTEDIIDVATSGSLRPRVIATDGNALFILLRNQATGAFDCRRYLLSDLSLTSADFNGYDGGDGLVYSDGGDGGSKVFVTAFINNSSKKFLLRMNATTMAIDGSADFPSGSLSTARLRLVATAAEIWEASAKDEARRMTRFNKTTMAVLTPVSTTIDLGALIVGHFDLAVDGQYVWELLDNGNAARWDTSIDPPDVRLFSIDFSTTATNWQFVGGPAPFIFTTRMLP